MIRRIFAAVIVIAIGASFIVGCKKDEPAEEAVKTAAEFKAEAEKEITEENFESELERMEKEIEADAAAQE